MTTVSRGLLTWTGWGRVSSSPQIIARGWPNREILAPESSCPGEFPLVELRLRVNDCDITFFLFFVPSAASKRKTENHFLKNKQSMLCRLSSVCRCLLKQLKLNGEKLKDNLVVTKETTA